MAFDEDINVRAGQIAELIHFWSATHSFCRRLLEDLDSKSDEERERFWKRLAETNHSAKELVELVRQCEMPDPYEMYRGY